MADPNSLTPTIARETIELLAGRLRASYASGVAIPPLRHDLPGGTIADAYAVQAENTHVWRRDGRVPVGAKIGLTAKTVQAQLGVDQPDFGRLFADMSLIDGETVAPGRLIQPRVEAEIAFVLDRTPLADRLTMAELINAVAYVLPAIEIVDSRIAAWDIKILDTIADNASSGLFVLGSNPVATAEVDFRMCGMVMEVNGQPVSFGAGAACLGNPWLALAWLARRMAELGTPLAEGDIVLSGALGPMVAVKPGDTVEARIEGLGRARIAFEREPPQG